MTLKIDEIWEKIEEGYGQFKWRREQLLVTNEEEIKKRDIELIEALLAPPRLQDDRG